MHVKEVKRLEDKGEEPLSFFHVGDTGSFFFGLSSLQASHLFDQGVSFFFMNRIFCPSVRRHRSGTRTRHVGSNCTQNTFILFSQRTSLTPSQPCVSVLAPHPRPLCSQANGKLWTAMAFIGVSNESLTISLVVDHLSALSI